MKITILGNNGPYPSPGGACSGYLITEGNAKILVDCGNGVLSNLLRFIRFEELDAIILTHLHSDHMSDMMVLRYAVQIKLNKGMMDKPISVFAPAEPAEEYARLDIKNVFNLRPISDALVLHYGDMELTFCEMTHPVKCFAVSVKNADRRFVFSGDTSWNDNIIRFSKGTDVVMLDAGLLSKDKTDPHVPHLTAEECGKVAARAGAGKLLLTHFWPEYDLKDILAEAKENFGQSELTHLLQTLEI